MKLLEENVLVDDHGVDGLVDGGHVVEHVVVVLVEDHEVVAEDHEVVAKVEEKARRLFFFSLWQDVCVVGVTVSAAHCSAPLAPDL